MKLYIVDAFTDTLFNGNTAAVCLIDEWPTDQLMQQIAMENNYSETAFTLKKEDETFDLRWFTPEGEIDLCGHATLATAFVLFEFNQAIANKTLTFHTKSGELQVTKRDDLYEMMFPSYDLVSIPVTKQMTDAFGLKPIEAYLGRDLLTVFSSEEDIKNMQPDIEKVKELDGLLQHVTSFNQEYDAISRSFAPKLGIPEDPVCGSGHCHIVPYWSNKHNKKLIKAFQASDRTGILYCEYLGDTVKIAGNAVLFATGEINS